MQKPQEIAPARGKLGILLAGMGAVATTTMAGILLARRGLAAPVGSLTQMGTIRLGKRTEGRTPRIADLVPLAQLADIELGGWDIFPDDAYQAALRAKVVDVAHLEPIREELSAIKPMRGAFYPEFVTRLTGTHVKSAVSKADMVEQLRADIRAFRAEKKVDRVVVVWCGSTETYLQHGDVHKTMSSFEAGLAANDRNISNAQLYAWACLKESVPMANGAPNLAFDFPAAIALAKETRTPIAGKDFKTGQTLMKTIIAPGLKARMLGLNGWYSTNILGNRDGEVLDDPASFKAKEATKLGVLDAILEPETHAELYGNVVHKVRIDYYPPRGDAKEGWDNIDLFGWMGYPMQIKINFLCRDSILAAPIVLDLALFLDLAQRARFRGIQEWLGFYFKSPMAAEGLKADHDLFVQLIKLKNTLRWMVGEDLITHLGNEYYD
ncbi:MAG: Inositol-phosphate synthase [Labilithrix sp.]|nr:Inositol-phosphate synthase [Labilithrix sp.]